MPRRREIEIIESLVVEPLPPEEASRRRRGIRRLLAELIVEALEREEQESTSHAATAETDTMQGEE